MKNYGKEELALENVLLVTPVAAAIILLIAIKQDPEHALRRRLAPELERALAEKEPWDIVHEPALRKDIKDAGLEDVDLLLSVLPDWFKKQDAVHVRGFIGKGTTENGEVEYDGGTMMAIVPKEGETGTIEDYKKRLYPMLGQEFPYARFFGDVSGTYRYDSACHYVKEELIILERSPHNGKRWYGGYITVDGTHKLVFNSDAAQMFQSMKWYTDRGYSVKCLDSSEEEAFTSGQSSLEQALSTMNFAVI